MDATLTLASGEQYAVTLVDFSNTYPSYSPLPDNRLALEKKLADSQALKRAASFGLLMREKLA